MSRDSNAPEAAGKAWPEPSDNDELSDQALDKVAGGVGITHITSVSPITPSTPAVVEQKQETLKKPS